MEAARRPDPAEHAAGSIPGSVNIPLDSMREQLDRIRCPVLILRGAESDVFTDADAERFAAALPDERWARIEGAGHAIQGDRPAELVREVGAFLSERGLA